jgi:large subunit ribosomal protein L15
MQFNNLPKLIQTPKKRVGRGLGSGKGKTSARGQKGQKARGKVPQGFIGGSLPLYKKLPYNRGHRNRKSQSNALAIQLSTLNILPTNTEVNLQTLIDNKLVDARQAMKYGVKIVGDSAITPALTVILPTSAKSASQIEKAGGKVVHG